MVTLTPMATATAKVAAKLRLSCCAAATGTTISALTSNNPTTRMATVTVTAAVIAVSRFSARTGSPVTRANSSSGLTANSCRRRPSVTRTTNAARTQIAVTSDCETVDSDPNRYDVRFALDPVGARLMNITPPAMPP